VRLHVPAPEVVVLRVSGDLDASTACVLAYRASQQLRRALHLVIDLCDVEFLDSSGLGVRGLDVLRTLHERAVAAGTQVHLVADHHAVRRPLHVSGLGAFLPVDASAEMAVARLILRSIEPELSQDRGPAVSPRSRGLVRRGGP
jgi:anti-sigma B factor antagonist